MAYSFVGEGGQFCQLSTASGKRRAPHCFRATARMISILPRSVAPIKGATHRALSRTTELARSVAQGQPPWEAIMNSALRWALLAVPLYATAAAAGLDPSQPTWWDKFSRLEQNGPMAGGERTASASAGAHVHVSNT